MMEALFPLIYQIYSLCYNYSSEKKVTGNTKKVPFLGDENLKKKGDEKAKKVIIIKCKLEGKGVN